MKSKFFIIFVLFSFLTACSSGGDGGGSAVIGAEGGAVTSVDGKMKLTIPAGALGSTETLSIAQIDPASLPPNLVGSPLAYEMKPDGLTFAQPVSVSLTAPDPPLQKDGSFKAPLGSLLTLSGSGSKLEALADQEITVDSDTNSTTFSGTLTHFSTLLLRIENIPESSSLFDKLLELVLGFPLLGRVEIKVSLLPPIMEIGKEEEAKLTVVSDSGAFTGLFRYKDQSQFPLIHFPEELRLMPNGFYSLIPSEFPKLVTTRLVPFGRYSCNQPSPSVEFKITVMFISATVETLESPGEPIPIKNQQVTFKSKHKCQLPPPPPSATLAITKDGTGGGRVVGAQAIDCGLNCAEVYSLGTVVVLAAGADEGSFFRGWATGSGCAGISTCTVTMDKDKTVTATFDKIPSAPPPSATDLGSVSPASLSNVHTVSGSPCPQEVGTFRLTRTPDTFGITYAISSNNPRFFITPNNNGSLISPIDFKVMFDCEAFPPQTGKITILLNGATKSQTLTVDVSLAAGS